jgi:hypothetical protein
MSKEIVIHVPDSRDAFHQFSAELTNLPNVDEVHFDFGKVSFATPGWMISIGAALRQFREEREEIGCKGVNFHHLTYPAHAGFFRFFGMKFGKALAAASANERFIPITPLLVEDIKDEAVEQMEHHGETLQRSSEKLIEVLLQSHGTPAFQALSYAMREIMRNVVEHSGSTDLAYVAQFWPGTGVAEIAITDRGIGLAKSLSSNPKIGRVSDDQALELGVQPGVSSKTWRKQSSRSDWNNSGYGLYMVKGLCVASGGALSIASGSLARTWSKRGGTTVPTHLQGTTVVLQLNSDNLDGIDRELEKLRGEARGGKPSPASLSLNPSKG